MNTLNNNAGTFTITNPAIMQFMSKTVGTVSRLNLTHKQNGGLHADSSVFAFQWTAPSTNIGNVTFYYAGVAGNNNDDDDSGDHMYNSSLVVTPGSAVGIAEEEETVSPELKAITIAAERKMMIAFNSTESANAEVFLFDLNGRKVSEMKSEKINSGRVNLEMNLPLDLQSGIYIVHVNTNKQQLSCKTTILL